MSNVNQCPSCGVKPVILKIATKGNGYLQFLHLQGCQIGQAVLQKGPICCSKCSAIFTLSNKTIFNYTDGGGTASLDCPICWAVAEAKNV
jgi:DNA-directed RNA polymerase subunit RPC12/RpoP